MLTGFKAILSPGLKSNDAENFLKLDAADGKAKTLDPQGLYSNLEVYLHYLVKDITAAQVAGGTYTALD